MYVLHINVFIFLLYICLEEGVLIKGAMSYVVLIYFRFFVISMFTLNKNAKGDCRRTKKF